MTRLRRALSLALLLLFVAGGLLRAEVVNRVVLRINDQIATLYDYERRRDEAVREISARVQDPAERRELLAQAPEMVFRDLYEQLLLDSRADQMGVDVADREIEATIVGMREEYGIKTDEEFERALSQAGMTVELLRRQVRNNLRVQEVRAREIRSRVQVDEEDLRRYYRKNQEQFRQPEQLQVREIVVREAVDGPAGQVGVPPEERQRIAMEIQQEVTAGKSLADAVAPYAQNGQATNVVDLGWVTKGDLDPGLEAAVWSLQPGAVSAPVAGRGGLHLLQVAERRPSRIAEFSEVADQIRNREQNRVYRDEMAKYMAELEKKSLIVANPPQEAAGFRRLLGKPPVDAERAFTEGSLASGGTEDAQGGTADRPQEPVFTGPGQPSAAGQPQAPGTLPEPKPTTDSPPPSPPPAGR